ncbi:MAG: MFS transporter [Porticoccaceae bacterium]|nr:MFS transporter [Porticoccaceae bacterium]
MTDLKQGATNSKAVHSDPYDNKGYRYYVLGILTMTYMFNFVDRQILSILQEPIKNELQLSDTQLGLLTGFAFAVFYIVLGLPIARWADQGIRRNIVAYALGLWSLMTAVCGMAQNFIHLLLARMGVGVGEAGCSPPSHSMISDIFPVKERATALATYNSGVNIGMLVGFLLGGWIHEFFGWRVALLAVGLPGLVLALIVRFTVAEPRRDPVPLNVDQSPEKHPSFKETLLLLWSRKTFRYMVMAGSLSSYSAYCLFNWMPSFLIRSYDLGTGLVGTWLSMSIGVGGAVGTFAIGYIADRFGSRDARWYPWVVAVVYGLALPFVIGMLLSDNSAQSLLLFIFPAAILASYLAPLITVTHSLVKVRMRAVSSAVVLLMVNLIGLGLGPVMVGALSDYMVPGFGVESLRYALLILVASALTLAILCYVLSARHIREEMAQMPR